MREKPGIHVLYGVVIAAAGPLYPGPVNAAEVEDRARLRSADPPSIPDDLVGPQREPLQGPAIAFINFDGAQLSQGEDARANRSFICQGAFPRWGDNANRKAAVLQAVRKDWEAYDVVLVTERPSSGNYDMIMAGNGRSICGQSSGIGGIAPMDCGDRQANNVVFSFGDAYGPGPDAQASVMSQELAHAYGLEHVAHRPEIMNPSYDGSDQSFLDRCFTVVEGRCGGHVGCPAGQQNSHAALLARLGPSRPDGSPPSVVITAPADGATFAEGADFVVSVDASDDRGVEGVALFVDGVEQSVDTSAPYSWDIAGIPVGVFTFEARAWDVAGNSTVSAPVTVEVDAGGGTAGSGGGTSGGTGGESSGGGSSSRGGTGDGSSGTDAAPTTDGDPDSDGDPPLPTAGGLSGDPFDDAGRSSGCACSGGTRSGGGLASPLFLLWVIWGALRRRA